MREIRESVRMRASEEAIRKGRGYIGLRRESRDDFAASLLEMLLEELGPHLLVVLGGPTYKKHFREAIIAQK